MAGQRHSATVETFDDGSGLGTVRLDDGRVFPFHCVSLVDGSRTTRPGMKVSVTLDFRVARTEAVDIDQS